MKDTLQGATLLFALALALLAPTARAQSPDPRDFEVGYFAPSGTTIVNAYLRHQSGTRGRDYDVDGISFRALHIIKLGELVLVPFDMLLPVVDQRLYQPLSAVLAPVNPAFAAVPSDLNLTLHATGLGDMVFLPTIGHGITQNAANHTHTWYALPTYITAPTGKYDPKRLLNIGQNRWVINPLLVLGQRFLRAFTLEAMANVAFYTDNDAYRARAPALAGKDVSLTQRPTLGFALHAGVDLHPGFFLAGSYLLAVNGRRDIVSQTPGEDLKQTETPGNVSIHSLRLNLGIRITPQTLLLAQWNEDVSGSSSAVLGRFFGVRVSHALVPTAASAPRAAEQR